MYIRPIDTIWDGRLYRSRLEARWAVFFDALAVEYRYEPLGYDLGGLQYLPDFWLPGLQCWVEIKPDNFGQVEEEKVARLALATKNPVFIFVGEPKPYKVRATPSGGRRYEGNGFGFLPELGEGLARENGFGFFECRVCSEIGIARIGADLPESMLRACAHEDAWDPRARMIASASKVALSERFEHGGSFTRVSVPVGTVTLGRFEKRAT